MQKKRPQNGLKHLNVKRTLYTLNTHPLRLKFYFLVALGHMPGHFLNL